MDFARKATVLAPDLGPALASLVIALLVMQILILIFRRLHRHKTFERMQIQGPKPHLIHGHLYDTRRQAYVKFAAKMHEQYGNNVGIYLGGDPYLVTKDLDLIQQVFVAKSRLFFDRMDFYLNVDPVPDNLICQRGDRWRYMRKLLTPAFSNSKIRSSHFYRDTQQTVAKFTNQLDEHSKLPPGGAATDANRRETIVDDLYDRMAAVALDVIVKTAFHMDNMISFKGPLSNNSEHRLGKVQPNPPAAAAAPDVFLNTVKRACRLGFNPLVELIFCFPLLDGPLTYLCNRLYFGSILKLLMSRLDYLVRRSKRPTGSGSSNGYHSTASDKQQQQPEDHSDQLANQPTNQQRRRIIDSLIEVLRERKITRSEFTGNAFVIVFAGFETTANALTFTLWLLARDQRVQCKLRDELKQQMARIEKSRADGADSAAADQRQQQQQQPSLDDLKLAELATGCSYLEMVINESLRLYPPVPGLSCRQASVDCQLSNGMTIEKGVNVVPSVFSIHRERDIWGQGANSFRPERFEMLDDAQLNSAMFMPFGLGPRNCIGKAVAMHEMKIAVGRLVLDYSMVPIPGKTPEKLKLCSPINITITSAQKIGLKFVKL